MCGARTTHSSSGYKAPWKARTRHFSLMAEGGLCLPSRVPRACMESRFESWAAQNYHNAHTQPTPGQVPSPSRASVRLSGDGQWIGPAAVWPERGLGSVVLLPPAAPLQPLSPLRAFPPLSASLPPRPLPFLSGCGSVSVSGHVFSPSLCVCLTQFLPFFFLICAALPLLPSFPPSLLPIFPLRLSSSLSPSLPPFLPNPASPSSLSPSICPTLAPPLAGPRGPPGCCLFLDEVCFPPAESLSPARLLPP